MWWRNSLRIAAVIALGALNAACFQPLYASRSVERRHAARHRSSRRCRSSASMPPNGTPEARIAVELQNALDFEMNGGGGADLADASPQGAHDRRTHRRSSPT